MFNILKTISIVLFDLFMPRMKNRNKYKFMKNKYHLLSLFEYKKSS